MSRKFKTSIECLHTLTDYNFSIPTYQRPYVWGDEQLKKLLDDLVISYQLNFDKDYFVSTFLTKDTGSTSELIDGQQRFTTLWIIAFVIKKFNSKSHIINFLQKDETLRLSFEIRKEVSDYLDYLLDPTNKIRKIDKNTIENFPYLKNIAKAIAFVKSYIDQLELNEEELENLGNFIYYKVKLVKNSTPDNTDLNKLFSVINSAGVQLEQSDIVKANLLKLVDKKLLFSRIWEACENMNNFFERNVKVSFPNLDLKLINFEKFIPFDEEKFKLDSFKLNSLKSKDFSIDDVDINNINYDQNSIEGSKKDDEIQDVIFCRSIISFPQLLLHTYRIHLRNEGLNDFSGTFHVNRLIEIFKDMTNRANCEEVERFFYLLWKVRYLFDKYIIKWISDVDNKSESLELLYFNRNEQGYYTRSKINNKTASLMLQSVLYFTGDYLRQYWLTSYLGFLSDNHRDLKSTDISLLNKLEEIDNSYSLNTLQTDKEISWCHINNINIEANFNIKEYFIEALGTSFKHYWFQKLEYIIWKTWDFEKEYKFNNFRITSKNSVEHIYPQNPENRIQHPELDKKYLDSFGNLVLLSVAQNSEYSNKSVKIKQSMFNEKSETFDSLKSYYVFRDLKEWNSESIDEHKNKMIKKILDYYE